jgi:hypothetical protein
MIPAPIADKVERRKAVVIGHDCFAIDHTLARGQCGDGSRGKKETRRKIVAVAGDEAHAGGVAVRNDGRRA